MCNIRTADQPERRHRHNNGNLTSEWWLGHTTGYCHYVTNINRVRDDMNRSSVLIDEQICVLKFPDIIKLKTLSFIY